MTKLDEIKQMDYDKLVPWFAQNKYNCAEIARQTNMGHAQVLKYFSRYLVQLQQEKVEEAQRCPSCGKLKNEVTEMKECRDVFHYL